jgi:hypothetical protein
VTAIEVIKGIGQCVETESDIYALHDVCSIKLELHNRWA